MSWWRGLHRRTPRIRFAVCLVCRLRHQLVSPDLDARLREFEARHLGHSVTTFDVCNPDDYLGLLAYAPNADVKEAFGTSTAITCTLASLAQAGARESTAIDNTTNLFLDVLVRLHCALQTGTPASDKLIYVYRYASEDGTNYTDNATGSDAAITLRSPTNLRLIGTISTPDSGALTYKSDPMSVAQTYGGLMPRKWGVAVLNMTNLTFSATEADHTKAYSGVYATVV